MLDKNVKEKLVGISKGNKKFIRCKSVRSVHSELLLTIEETLLNIKEQKCEDAIQYILWNDFLNNKGTLANKNENAYHRYVWGDKVFIDFGVTNIKTELSYPHPAIVLCNYANTIIVVPTTTDDKATAFSQDIEESIIKIKKDNNIFINDSIINTHQIKAVHKERIINDLNCSVKNYVVNNDEINRLNSYEDFKYFNYGSNLLECIRTKVNLLLNKLSMYNSYIYEAYAFNENFDLIKRITELEEINEGLNEQIVEISKSKKIS